ncbi:MAG: Bug family tripartite tricarboxylate transporter substrate binding protein [Burkholderiales bacterium]
MKTSQTRAFQLAKRFKTALKQSFLAMALGFAITSPAHAQSYPAKPMRLIVGFPPGGLVDVVARAMQPTLQSSLGQPMIVENQAGAVGTIAEAALAKSAPDGYTMLMSADGPPANMHLFRNPSYDLFRDLRAVSMLVRVPLSLLAHPSVPATTMQEFISHAKGKKGAVNYASPATGYLYMELLKGIGGFEMTHIAYKGGAPAMTDLLGGQLDALLISVTLAAPNVRSGKARALAIAGDKRSGMLPQVPLFAEAGIRDFNPYFWSGLFLPAKVPQPLVQRLHGEFANALKDAALQKRLQEFGAEVVMNSPDQFAAFLKAESDRLGQLIRERNITVN